MSKARERIIAKATDLFYNQGYNSTGVNQIIEEASVAKSTLFQHFRSKTALCLTYLDKTSSELLQTIAIILKNGTSDRDKILSIFQQLKNDMEESNYRGCHFLNILSEVPLSETLIVDAVKTHKTKLREMLAGLFEEEENKSYADLIYVLYEGAIVESQVQQNSWPIDCAIQSIKAIIK